MDYLKLYEAKDTISQQEDTYGKFMELNCFDEDDNPKFGWNVYPQRTVSLPLSVQYKAFNITLECLHSAKTRRHVGCAIRFRD